MSTLINSAYLLGKSILILSLAIYANVASSRQLNAVVDDFSHVSQNNLGIARLHINDTTSGGQTTVESIVANGVMQVKGEIVPPRGQPGWASSVLLLNTTGASSDASAYEGIKLVVKLNKGSLSISANSTEVTNFDYHAALVAVPADGQFHVIKVPFNSMQRLWSEQTALNRSTLASLSIVAFGIKKSAFDFVVDEVSFY